MEIVSREMVVKVNREGVLKGRKGEEEEIEGKIEANRRK